MEIALPSGTASVTSASSAQVLIASPKLDSDVDYSTIVANASQILQEMGIAIKTLASHHDGTQYIFTVNKSL